MEDHPTVADRNLRDVMQRLWSIIEQLRLDADLRMEISIDETDLMDVSFVAQSGETTVHVPIKGIAGEIKRRAWSERA